MIFIRTISQDEMIFHFLKAELNSSRFREGSLKAMKTLKLNESLLDVEDFDNTQHNQQRSELLHLTRGWPNEFLFTNFPKDTDWMLTEITTEELRNVYRLKSRVGMSTEERLLKHTADLVLQNKDVRNIDNNLIEQIRKQIDDGIMQPPIIMVAQDLKSKRVLIEGHSRSVAYCTARELKNIPAILGVSRSMVAWEYF